MAGLIVAGSSGGLANRAMGAAGTSARSLELAASSDPAVVEFAYVDETGNTGSVGRGASRTYTLGCVLVPADGWTSRLQVLTAMRRDIKKTYDIRLRDELKAYYLVRSRGPLKDSGFGDGQLRDIYHRSLSAVTRVSAGVFAVVIDKLRRMNRDPFDAAWERLVRQLMVRSTSLDRSIVLVHDQGDNDRIRRMHRRCRQSTAIDGTVCPGLLVEDPVPRRSELSYFVQAADLVAYAAFRRIQPPGKSSGLVCDANMWEVLKAIWLTEVSQSRSDGILVWPEQERGHPQRCP